MNNMKYKKQFITLLFMKLNILFFILINKSFNSYFDKNDIKNSLN
jgi:hypothetical protein